MIFTETKLAAAFIIDIDKLEDPRGFFGRAWSREEFGARGLSTTFVQANIALSHRKGTLRGLHYQAAPHEEAKLIRCSRGAVFDVAVDLRPSSVTYKQWISAELTADNYRMLYIPEGCAHGYQTLTDDAEVFYLVSASYSPQAERGIRYDDPGIGINWPLEPGVVSDKDRGWPPYPG